MARMTRTREEIEAEKARKPRPDLIPGAARIAVGRVLAMGCAKHGRCTWTEAGTEQARGETHIASAERHLAALGDSYDALDDESGLPHLWHAAAQMLIAIDCMARAQGTERAPDALPEGWRVVRSDAYLEWELYDPSGRSRAWCTSHAVAVARARELAGAPAQDELPEGWAVDHDESADIWDLHNPDGAYRGAYASRARAVARAHEFARTRA